MQPRMTPKPGLTIDYLVWLITRISGLLLLLQSVTALGMAMYLGARLQMNIADVFRWAFYPTYNHVVNTNVPDVSLGWVSAYWNFIQVLVIVFASIHAANGLRMIAEDYVGSRTWRNILRTLILLVWAAFMYLGISVILGSSYY